MEINSKRLKDQKDDNNHIKTFFFCSDQFVLKTMLFLSRNINISIPFETE